MIIKKRSKGISLFVLAALVLTLVMPGVAMAEAEKPEINPNGGTYDEAITVTIGNIHSGTTVYYTTDGSNPTTDSDADEYVGAFTVDESLTVKAAAYEEDSGDWSAVASEAYTIDESTDVEEPEINPNGGTYDEAIRVSISNIHSGTVVYYTTNGDDPRDRNDAERYYGAFTVDESLTLKAAAYDTGDEEWSDVVSESYTIDEDSAEVEKPVINPDGGTYDEAVRVTISNIHSGTTVYYTTDGSDPRDENDAEEYDGAFSVDESLTLKAAAYDEGEDEWSAVVSEKYVIDEDSEDSEDEDTNNSNDIDKLKEKFAEAVRKNHMVQAMQILNRIKMLSARDEASDQLEELKDEIIDAVNDEDWEQAEQILKEIIRLERSPWAYEQLGQIYEKSGKNGVCVFSEGTEINFDVQPMIINGRTMVPIRKVANALGLDDNKVRWNNGMVTIDNGSDQIILANNSNKVKFKGKYYDTDVPAQIVNGRMLVPLRVVSEMFNKNVQWYPKGKIVSISNR